MPAKRTHRADRLAVDAAALPFERAGMTIDCQGACRAEQLLDAPAIAHQASVSALLLAHPGQLLDAVILCPGWCGHSQFGFDRDPRLLESRVNRSIGENAETPAQLVFDPAIIGRIIKTEPPCAEWCAG